jgi:hypothetical protein
MRTGHQFITLTIAGGFRVYRRNQNRFVVSGDPTVNPHEQGQCANRFVGCPPARGVRLRADETLRIF